MSPGRTVLRGVVALMLPSALVSGCAGGASSPAESVSSAWSTTSPSVTTSAPRVSPSGSGGDAPPPTSPPASPGSAPPTSPSVESQDAVAGVRSRRVPQVGGGTLVTVPGSAGAPGRGATVTVRVRVEQGLAVDGPAFASFVMATLNDDRSWGHGGTRTFARTAGPADVTVTLASPTTSAALCRPLRTYGRLSCGVGDDAVITLYRWVNAMDEYGDDLTGYRRYVINHEVGHTLGKDHVTCPGAGRRAPVMMQQTKGLQGCTPNSWPYP